MKISELVNQLNQMKSIHGDIEVTQIGTLEPINQKNPLKGSFESTVETLLHKNDEFAGEKNSDRVLIAWQC